jgi:hypothetical protein
VLRVVERALYSMRERLLSALFKLADQRMPLLEAQLEALGKELKGVDVEVEASRRMLGLAVTDSSEDISCTGLEHSTFEGEAESELFSLHEYNTTT